MSVATRPKEEKESTAGDKDRGFKLASDGRLIITQDAEEEENKKSRKRMICLCIRTCVSKSNVFFFILQKLNNFFYGIPLHNL